MRSQRPGRGLGCWSPSPAPPAPPRAPGQSRAGPGLRTLPICVSAVPPSSLACSLPPLPGPPPSQTGPRLGLCLPLCPGQHTPHSAWCGASPLPGQTGPVRELAPPYAGGPSSKQRVPSPMREVPGRAPRCLQVALSTWWTDSAPLLSPSSALSFLLQPRLRLSPLPAHRPPRAHPNTPLAWEPAPTCQEGAGTGEGHWALPGGGRPRAPRGSAPNGRFVLIKSLICLSDLQDDAQR